MKHAAHNPGMRRRRNVRVIREPDRIQTRLLFWALLAGLLVLVPLLANVWGHAESVRLGYRIEEARAARAALLETNRLLRAEHATLRDLDRVQRYAMDKLGLAPRRPDSTVVVSIVEPTQPTDGDQSAEPQLVAVRTAAGVQGGSK